MHMPQNVLAETELRHLAAIPYQVLTPVGPSPLIGIYQDSLLGSYRFTRPNVKLTPREAMNLLMAFPRVDVKALEEKKDDLTSFDVLSQIMPELTLKYKKDDNVMDIRNGKYISGQLEKAMLGASSRGILHRIYNDFGPFAATDFIDDLQNVITEYMKTSSFSVGISDLVANKVTQDRIIQIITEKKSEVQSELDKLHLGIFENETSNSNMVHFETTVNNILNKATELSGKEGRKSLNKNNRFLMIVESGSKGSLVNISQMISCLGQTNVDGKRIAYGFTDRTLPHFKKFDDSPGARGFIENSYISGLTAPELFFHAMGGRIGLIDTACKSVTWETPIVILENNKPKYIEIGRWIDSKLESANPEEVQHFTDRQMELMNIDSAYIPTTDENGVVTWGEVTAITRHDPGTALYEIKTWGGRSVIVTESKSLLIWDPITQKLVETSTPDIKVGDCVPVTESLSKPPVTLDEIKFNTSSSIMLNNANGIYIGRFLANGIINPDISEYLNTLTEKYVPTEAFVASDDFIIGILSGYFTESIHFTESEILVNSSSTRLLEGLNMLCSRFGIFGSIQYINNEYSLRISAQWGQRFADTIPLLEENKQRKLKSLSWRASHMNFNTYNNVVLDKIVEINILGVEKYPKVYDLTIPSTLNFGLANGLQVRDTSSTGYIQRRLIKGLEDLKVEYDMTVRNNRGKIIQFAYGDDGIDSTKAESQSVPLVSMTPEDIYMHYDIAGVAPDSTAEKMAVYTKGAAARLKKQRPETIKKIAEYIERMIDVRDKLVSDVFHYKNDNSVKVPVSFQHIIANIQGQLGINSHSTTDITPLEAFDMIEFTYKKLQQITFAPPTKLFEVLYYYYLNPRDLLVHKRLHRKAIELLLETVVLKYKQSIVHPGEMVGVIAGQSIGEPTTQLTLNSVTYETEIVVRNQRHEIKAVKIGDFVTEHMKKSKTIEYMEDKDTTYAELCPEDEYYEVPSANEQGETVWTRIEAVTQHPVINEDGTDTMLKITTSGCREVIVTKAKSVLQLVDGKIIPVSGKDLTVDDYFPCSKKPLEFEPKHELNLRSILLPTEYLYGRDYHIAKSVMHEYHWWSKHSGKEFVLPHSRSDSFVELTKSAKCIDESCVYMKLVNMCGYNVPAVIPLDYDFGYLVGAYCAEGCMTKHQISISNNDAEYFGPILRLCEKWNLTTKVYRNENKNKEGWTSQDIRIYNTLLCHILENLCGKLSDNKFVSDRIIFSNRECMLGFLDAYIGGDGHLSKASHGSTDRMTGIIITSVSLRMLTDVMIMLKNLGVVGNIHKPKKQETNNRGSKDIKQIYKLNITNRQSQILGRMLHLPIKSKQERINKLLTQKFKYEYDRAYLTVPNKIGGEIVFDDRGETMPDLIFDKIVSIEEVPNTTKYAYDLTVAVTRNFDCMNGLALLDTFHLAGVSAKSNVTRGVPRIEEILRLTDNPKKPALTIHLKPIDETDKDRASTYANMLEHTVLRDVVKTVQICFDPLERSTFIEDDKKLVERYYAFEDMIRECKEEQEGEPSQKSKWIVRMEIDAESLLEKNITMDDIHFAIKNANSDIQCVYSDYNDSNLIFRIRMNGDTFKKKKGAVQSLDQSDEIYLLKNFQDGLLNNIVLRGVKGIENVLPRKLQNMVVKEDGKYVRKDLWVLDTTGTNLLDILGTDFIDSERTYSNDISELFDVLGIEAARQSIFNEFAEVMEFSDVNINYHHLSLLCDRMTVTKSMVAIFRSGLHNDNIGPIAKATFEVHTEILLNAARHADFDEMRGVSANVMCGQFGYYGTGAFNVILDMKEIAKVEARDATIEDTNKDIDNAFGFKESSATETCGFIQNNISAIHQENEGICQDNYDMGF